MWRPRVIPVLLLRGEALVKSTRFAEHRYIGDPINTVRIFNDLGADEVVLLDIDATRKGRLVDVELVRAVGEEANMPLAVGGGIRSLEDIRSVLGAGAEKVVLGTIAAERPAFVEEAANAFGSSAVVVCVDARGTGPGRRAHVRNGRASTSSTPLELARALAARGAGEIIIQSVDRDGTMQGYDLELVREIAQAVDVPVVALGGAGHLDHLDSAFHEAGASGLAAGSLFVFHGPRRGVLVSYPLPSQLVRPRLPCSIRCLPPRLGPKCPARERPIGNALAA